MRFGKSIAAMTLATALVGTVPTAAFAHEHEGRGWHRGGDHDDGDDEGDGDYRGYGRRPAYYQAPAYAQPYRCRTSGTTGLILGGAAGALLGREIARDRTLGAILGGSAGALAGRALTRKNRC